MVSIASAQCPPTVRGTRRHPVTSAAIVGAMLTTRTSVWKVAALGGVGWASLFFVFMAVAFPPPRNLPLLAELSAVGGAFLATAMTVLVLRRRARSHTG
jgi:hypothetical protein